MKTKPQMSPEIKLVVRQLANLAAMKLTFKRKYPQDAYYAGSFNATISAAKMIARSAANISMLASIYG